MCALALELASSCAYPVAETNWQVKQCQTELSGHRMREVVSVDEDLTDKMYSALIEYQAASDDPLTFQAAMLPSKTIEFTKLADERGIAVQAHGGSGIVVGHLPDSCTTATQANELLGPLRRFAEQRQGALVVMNCDNSWKPDISLFGDRDANRFLDERVRQALDPRDLLNPGRMWRTDEENSEGRMSKE